MSVPWIRASRVLLAAAAAALAVGGVASSMADNGGPEASLPPEDHPIPGWVYELSYRTDNGKVTGLVAYDREGPPFYGQSERDSLVVGSNEAVMDITSYPQLKLVLDDIDSFNVDPETRELKQGPAISASREGEEPVLARAADWGPLLALLSVGVLLAVAKVRRQ